MNLLFIYNMYNIYKYLIKNNHNSLKLYPSNNAKFFK